MADANAGAQRAVRPPSQGTLEDWHRAFAAIGVVPHTFTWRERGDSLTAFSAAWFDGDTEVFATTPVTPASVANLIVYVIDPRLARHPAAVWVPVVDASDRLALIQTVPKGTWMIRAGGRRPAIAVGVFTRTPAVLSLVQRRAREIAVGGGETPRPVQSSAIAQRAQLLQVSVSGFGGGVTLAWPPSPIAMSFALAQPAPTTPFDTVHW